MSEINTIKELSEGKEISAIIFERSIIKEYEYTTVYYYTPIEVVRGFETEYNGTKTFVAKHVKSLQNEENNNYNPENKEYEFAIMDDTTCQEERFVYGFPIELDEERKKDYKETKEEMLSLIDAIEVYKIMQATNNHDTTSKIFLVGANNSKTSINPNDFYDLSNTVYDFSLDKIDEASDLLDKETIEADNKKVNIVPEKKYVYSDEMAEGIGKTVICQDIPIRIISTAIAKNSRLNEKYLKSCLLICGKTGVGKTLIWETMKRIIDVPVHIEDSTEYTVAGYKGNDVTNILVHLLRLANGDIEKAQHGIIILDEIDKKASNNDEHVIYTSGVIDSFLKMMEGHIYSIEYDRGVYVNFDTSLLTFAFSGAFSGIEEYVKSKSPIGFISQGELQTYDDSEKIFTDETVIKYGLKPEFVGRCDLIALNNLNKEDLITILKTSDKNHLLLYKYLFNEMGIDFIYDDSTIEAIAKKAHELGLGVRSANKIINNALAVANYYAFSKAKYSKLIISPETIEDNTKFILK